MFTESLTVRILGDSSGLRRELEDVSGRVSELSSKLRQVGDANRQLSGIGDSVSRAVRPLQNVSRLLDRIAGQARGLGRIPITLNVAPALNALAQLTRAAQIAAAGIRAIGPVGRGGGGSPLPFSSRVARFATGGPVVGPAGVDQIPALLTAGEFVISRPAVDRLGNTFLDALNRSQPSPRSRPVAADATGSPAQATSGRTAALGDITINVSRGSDVNQIVRDLRLHGYRLRHRRG